MLAMIVGSLGTPCIKGALPAWTSAQSARKGYLSIGFFFGFKKKSRKKSREISQTVHLQQVSERGTFCQ